MKNFNRIQSLKDISKNLSVLYVDDDEDLVNRTKKFLIKIFKHVDLATNGVEGLDFYKEYYNKTAKNYDIIISDIYKPNMNGIAMSKAILDINKDQKIIILSAYKERNYLLDIISLGIDSFIQKPFDIKQMLEVLYKVCITFQFEDLQYFKSLTEASIVSKTDIDGIIIYANDNFCNITGYSRKEIIGKTHSLFKHPDNPDSLYDDL